MLIVIMCITHLEISFVWKEHFEKFLWNWLEKGNKNAFNYAFVYTNNFL